jgi:hypothetical protein
MTIKWRRERWSGLVARTGEGKERRGEKYEQNFGIKM